MKMNSVFLFLIFIVLTGCVNIEPLTVFQPSTFSGNASYEFSPGPGWDLAWGDEFDGTSLDTNNWTFDLGGGGWGNSELETYTATNATVNNGVLTITAYKDFFGNYTSSRLKTLGLKSFQYGLVVARIKLPKGNGMFPAFWMMGTNKNIVGWPSCGEIDIMEMAGGVTGAAKGGGDNVSYGAIHGGAVDYYSGMGVGGKTSVTGAFNDDYHTFAIEWTDKSIDWYLDGVNFFHADANNIPTHDYSTFTKPFFILLNLAVGGNCGGSGWPGYPDVTTEFPQTLEVDWVRVYQRDPMKPSISVLYPSMNSTLYGKFYIGGAASSTNGVSNVMLSVDGQTFSAVTGTGSWYSNLTLSPGLHTINTYTLDCSNVTSWTNSMQVTITTTPPEFYFTNMPPIGDGSPIKGKLSGLTLSEYRLCLYIYVPSWGWVVKPYYATPYSSTLADGSWSIPYNTGGIDYTATWIEVFLVSRGYTVINPNPSLADMQNNAAIPLIVYRGDVIAPTIANSSPTNGASVVGTNYNYMISGSCSDNIAVQKVFLSLNGGEYSTATVSGATWSSNVSVAPGANTVSVFALDYNNNYSATNTISFTYAEY